MRERAKAATRGPWLGDPTGTVSAASDLVTDTDGSDLLPAGCPMEVAECYRNEARGERGNNAEHIASWHPGVAHPVADSLERVADTFTPDQLILGQDFWSPEQHAALSVARTYPGGDR